MYLHKCYLSVAKKPKLKDLTVSAQKCITNTQANTHAHINTHVDEHTGMSTCSHKHTHTHTNTRTHRSSMSVFKMSIRGLFLGDLTHCCVQVSVNG